MITWPLSLKKTSARLEVLSAFEKSLSPLSVAQVQVLCPTTRKDINDRFDIIAKRYPAPFLTNRI